MLLLNALETDGPGILIHPTIRLGNPILVMVDAYTMTETREKGGYALFEMSFVERGNPINQDVIQATGMIVSQGAAQFGQTAAGAMDQNLTDLPSLVSPSVAFQTLQQSVQ